MRVGEPLADVGAEVPAPVRPSFFTPRCSRSLARRCSLRTIWRVTRCRRSSPRAQARTEERVDGRRTHGADPLRARPLPIRRREIPQGVGAAAPGRSTHLQGPRAAADAEGGAARPHARQTPLGTAGARRHDHHRAPRRNVKHRRHCLLHHRGGERHGLRRRSKNLRSTPARRSASASTRRARACVRGAGAAAPGTAGALRQLPGWHRRRTEPAPRPRQPVSRRPLPGRDPLLGHQIEPVVRGGARRRWLRLALLAFEDRHNRRRLMERHGHRTPAAVREALRSTTSVAA